MFERSELRSRREERMENGVKNLKGARLFPKTYALVRNYNDYGDSCVPQFFLESPRLLCHYLSSSFKNVITY
jgi:hypothetical protein